MRQAEDGIQRAGGDRSSADSALGRWTWVFGSVGAAIGLFGVIFIVAHLVPLPDRLRARDSTVVEWKNGTAAHVFLSEDERWRMPADLAHIDPGYIEALLSVEDERFWWHPGVDPLSVVRAAWSNLIHGRIVSGASTVTMQLVRLLEPRPRTFRSKVVEAFRAVQLELRMSKRQILEAYLSYVPYGRNYEGVETAAYLYFDKSARRLTPAQMATLIAVPQAPGARFPNHENRSRLRAARNEILRGLAADGVFEGRVSVESPSGLVDTAGDGGLPRRMHALPDAAPHVARWLAERHPGDRRIETTLDRGIQRQVKGEFDSRRARLQSRGIHNGAGVVVEHRSGAVRAVVGNFEFFDPEHGGQIPGFDVHRSTGSLLKPFIYAMAIDRGLAAASHLVPDVPTSFGGYRPENFNDEYAGLIRLESALSQSKNIPFVRLVKKLGVHRFLTKLRRLGVDGFERPSADYGVSVAVGGIALTPLEVARIYTALARGGSPASVHLINSADATSAGRSSPVISEGASWLTNRALRKRDRPDFPTRRSATNIPTGIHWKTGTSARNHDAWSAGFGPRYTAAIWLGNFDNTRSPSLVGSEAAGPLFFDVLEAIEQEVGDIDETPPDELTEVEVCALSGHIPTDACPNRKRALMVQSDIATEECPYHVTRRVHAESGLAVPPGCGADLKTESKSFVQLPSGTARWMGARFGQIQQPPALHPACEGAGSSLAAGSGPTIVWPPPHHEVVLLRMFPPDEQQIPLEAEVPAGGATLHWFVDGSFLASRSADQRAWWTPSVGTHRITVMDAAGRSVTRSVKVRRRGNTPGPR